MKSMARTFGVGFALALAGGSYLVIAPQPPAAPPQPMSFFVTSAVSGQVGAHGGSAGGGRRGRPVKPRPRARHPQPRRPAATTPATNTAPPRCGGWRRNSRSSAASSNAFASPRTRPSSTSSWPIGGIDRRMSRSGQRPSCFSWQSPRQCLNHGLAPRPQVLLGHLYVGVVTLAQRALDRVRRRVDGCRLDDRRHCHGAHHRGPALDAVGFSHRRLYSSAIRTPVRVTSGVLRPR